MFQDKLLVLKYCIFSCHSHALKLLSDPRRPSGPPPYSEGRPKATCLGRCPHGRAMRLCPGKSHLPETLHWSKKGSTFLWVSPKHPGPGGTELSHRGQAQQRQGTRALKSDLRTTGSTSWPRSFNKLPLSFIDLLAILRAPETRKHSLFFRKFPSCLLPSPALPGLIGGGRESQHSMPFSPTLTVNHAETNLPATAWSWGVSYHEVGRGEKG